MIKRFNAGLLMGGEQPSGEMPSSLIRDVLLVYSGKFKSMDGDVEIKDDDINKLASNHNSLMSKLSRLAGGKEVPAKHSPPLQLDHSQSATHTVGRLVGNVEAKEYEDPDDGEKKLGLYGKVKFLGKENVEKALDGRYTHVSIGADLTNHKISELTITPFPAAANASLLSKGKEEDMDYASMKEKLSMYEKCKRHLMEEKKMSEEDAEKHMAALPEGDCKQMAAEQDDKDKKMAAEKEEADKKLAEEKVKEEETKKADMAAKNEKITKLRAELKAGEETVRLAARKSSVSIRLSKLRSTAKITPAEIKKLKIEDIAKMTDEALEAFFKGFEARENVIPVGQLGSFRAKSQAELAGDIKKLAKDELLEETLANMPMLSKMRSGLKADETARLASDAEAQMGGDVPVPAAPHDQNPGSEHATEMEAAYATMKKLMDEGRHDEAKAHYMATMSKKLASAAEEHMASDAEAHMSGLENEMKKMHNNFNEYEKLVAPILGLSN